MNTDALFSNTLKTLSPLPRNYEERVLKELLRGNFYEITFYDLGRVKV